MILAPSDFRDEEYLVPREVWEKAGCEVKTASSEPHSTGRFDCQVENDLLLSEVKESDFDGLFFVGGGGSLIWLENETAKNLALSFFDADKPLGAICAAPRNFLVWGILSGKKATGHNWDGEFPNLCQKFQAIFSENPVVTDGKILTANGPEAAEICALEFLKLFT